MTSTTTLPGAVELRPSSHFTAATGWLNDPNGLLYYNGRYHLFFQHNPHGNDWGNISWGHATSKDLVTWTEQDVAIPCTPQEAAFSGSAVADVRNTAGFATPGETALVAIFTSNYSSQSPLAGRQAQSLAYSLDEGVTWTRYAGNPVLDTGSSNFRDPKVFWFDDGDVDQGGRWIMVAVEAQDRQVVIYSSPNLRDWSLESRFGPAHASAGCWECPDLFPLTVRGSDEVRWVLVVSLNPGAIAGGSGTQYFVGDFDGTRFIPERLSDSDQLESYDWLDFGRDYYAAVSFNDAPDGRRLMIGWASNWDYAHATPTSPWRSTMSLVREVELVRCSDGRLRLTQYPILPTEDEHDDSANPLVIRLAVSLATGEQTAVVLSAADPTDGEVTLILDGDAGTLTSDRTRSGEVGFHPTFASVDVAPLLGEVTDAVDLLIVVDGCLLEVFVDGGLTTLTQQIFPRNPLTSVRVIEAPA